MTTLTAPTMTCDRCQGFLMTDHEETRCLNCGHRPGLLLLAPEPPRQGRRRQCSNCQEYAVVGHHYCQRHLDYFVAYRRQKKATREGLPCTD